MAQSQQIDKNATSEQETQKPAKKKHNNLQLLTFLLDNEIYGTDISQIQEVLEYRKVTPVPRTPDFMLGVINLRGQVVPVVDLRRQFEMQVSEVTVNTCIVIVDVIVEGEKTALGLLADAVKEVLELNIIDITPPPRIGSSIDTRYISGMGKNGDDFIIILNLARVFSPDEIEGVFDALPSSEETGESATE
ncbi:purine-binding chemotaxis protein CheW [Alteromonadaceae bacterium 2753L.S.0a.02]|nr:purine-binding chemotaxis protein CheW [Alteromonadaceae bacterium 2753L.S.0a.02]